MNKPFTPAYPQAKAASRGTEGENRARTTFYRSCVSFVSIALVLPSLVLFSPMFAFASPFAGKITAIDSGPAPQLVNIVRPANKALVQAKLGDAVFIGDTVKTGSGVKARIELSDKTLVNIGPDSAFRVKGYVLSPAEAKRNYTLKALKGTIRFIISKVFKTGMSGAEFPWKDSNITVETATAVAGVRGTDFTVIVDIVKPAAPSVDIAVFEGLITVRNIELSIPDVILLSANEVTSVRRGIKPEKPEALSQKRKDQLMSTTTPAAAAPSLSGVVTGAQNKPAENYTSDDMARDLAAGVPLPEVLDQAAASGMTIDRMVAAALEAGVEPNTVVYTAITEGYPAQAVVTAAVSNGAPLYEVIAAAIAAGAEKRAVIAGATNAGAPSDIVAGDIARAREPGAPVFGGQFFALPPIEYIPAPPILVSGGGGVTPSTLPASPYKP